MPASSVDPGIDEERQYEEVERTTHEHARQEGHHELEPAHPAAAKGSTARTYPVGGTGSRSGSDQRAVMREGWARRAALSTWPIGPYRRATRSGRVALRC